MSPRMIASEIQLYGYVEEIRPYMMDLIRKGMLPDIHQWPVKAFA